MVLQPATSKPQSKVKVMTKKISKEDFLEAVAAAAELYVTEAEHQDGDAALEGVMEQLLEDFGLWLQMGGHR